MSRTKPNLISIEGFKEDAKDLQIVRPELNIERWGGLFVPSQARGSKNKIRKLIKETRLQNGNVITDILTVGYCEHGTLTTKDHRVLLALLQIWEENGCSLSHCYFSVYRLLQILKLEYDSGRHIETVIESLRRLRGVTLTFEQCFFDAETQTVDGDMEPIQILGGLKIKYRKKLKDGTYESSGSENIGRFHFHPRILKNLTKNYTRPVLLNVVLSLESGIAQLIYNLVDRQIVGKYTYNITTENLFRELGLQGKKYKSVSGRKQALEKPLAELIGKPLSSGGFISSVELVVTKSGNDYKVVIAKKDKSQRLQPVKAETIEHAPPSDVIEVKQEPTPPQVDKRTSFLLSELKAVGITEAKARELVAQYPYECEKQIESLPFRDLSKVKNKAAWLITAITQGYEIAEGIEQQKQEMERKQQREADKRAQANCKYCEHSPGWHIIYTEQQPNGGAKQCTHDPAVESKFRSRWSDEDDEEGMEEEPIELQEQELVECDFCHPYAPGYHRIATTENTQGWTLRKCSHDPVIESQFKVLM